MPRVNANGIEGNRGLVRSCTWSGARSVPGRRLYCVFWVDSTIFAYALQVSCWFGSKSVNERVGGKVTSMYTRAVRRVALPTGGGPGCTDMRVLSRNGIVKGEDVLLECRWFASDSMNGVTFGNNRALADDFTQTLNVLDPSSALREDACSVR